MLFGGWILEQTFLEVFDKVEGSFCSFTLRVLQFCFLSLKNEKRTTLNAYLIFWSTKCDIKMTQAKRLENENQ